MRLPALRRRAGALVAALALFAAGAAGAPGDAANETTPFSKLPRLFFGETPAPLLSTAAVLAHYESAVQAAKSPRYVTFAFSIEQVGAHILSQAHYVYRDGLNERDETTHLDGKSLPRPLVRIFRNHTNHYDLGAVAPRVSDYDFRLTATQHDGDHDDYTFATTSHRDRPFAISSVVIDGSRFLPTELGFHIDGGPLRGQGRLVYGPTDKYWLVRLAEVSAHDGSGNSSRERIVWSGYQFPDDLPPSTFSSRVPADVEPFSEPGPRPEGEPPGLPAPARPPGASPAGSPSRAARPATAPPALRQPPTIGVPTKAPAPVKTPAPVPKAPAATHPRPHALGTPEVLQGPVTPAPLRDETPVPVATFPPPPTAAPAASTALPGSAGQP